MRRSRRRPRAPAPKAPDDFGVERLTSSASGASARSAL
jgi:hypothetical protein